MTARPHLNPYVAGVLLGGLVFLAFALTQNGICTFSSVRHFDVALLQALGGRHPNHVGYFAMTGTSVLSALNHPAISMGLGLLGGAMLVAWRHRRLKLEVLRPDAMTVRTRLLLAALGGALVGFGAAMARGCLAGQFLSGASLLSLGGWIVALSLMGTAFLMARVVRRIWN
ncbi:MAG: YeeE/YedE family protein [Firmicutes bacterium]|nr:YeeE/YedE family protein [Bacillota bacterium]